MKKIYVWLVAAAILAGSQMADSSNTGNCASKKMNMTAHAESNEMAQSMMKQGMSESQMMSMVGGADSKYDLRFINMMIPHHEMAVKMAKDALAKATHPELKKKAQEIIDAQQKEIDEMKAWRKQWYGK